MDEQCVYCLATLTPVTRTIDHVIARSWFPSSSTPIRKWKVPACRTCNFRFSQIEGRVLQRLTLTINVRDPALKHLYEKTRRAWKTDAFASVTDTFFRRQNWHALLRSTRTVNALSASKALPYSRRNYWLGSRTEIQLPKEDIEALVGKWVRGIHYCEFKCLIPGDHRITPHFITDEGVQAMKEAAKDAPVIRRGPYVEVQILTNNQENPLAAIYRIKLWRAFEVFADIDKIAA